MKKNFKSIFKYILLAPLLMAFQCDDEEVSNIEYNAYNLKITPQKTFSLNDTIWVQGRVSAKAFDTAINDSIFNNNIEGNQFSIYKFITPEEHSNAKDAIDSFELVYKRGSYFFIENCQNAELTALPVLENNNSFYSFKLGLKPKQKGDFIISGLEGKIQNTERNLEIARKYPLVRHPDQIGFLRCDAVSWLFLEDSTREFLFTVE
ncbi:hypothetical protein [Polaribacter aestuariivivens]|uniref:hypothetical protein n=1 Tax=Polaribacter aestuariivivens TaxID=2304626 RepID=UPI003F497FB3